MHGPCKLNMKYLLRFVLPGLAALALNQSGQVTRTNGGTQSNSDVTVVPSGIQETTGRRNIICYHQLPLFRHRTISLLYLASQEKAFTH